MRRASGGATLMRQLSANSNPKGPMLNFLFRGLTAEPARGAALFDALTARTRQPHWYREGKVPDTLDGRFAVLATLTALVIVRLEGEGEAGQAASVALTERFIEVMESEHRELGLGDPTLGRTVRKLVGSLARRTDLWRSAVQGERDWAGAAHDSLYRAEAPADALQHCAAELQRFWQGLQRCALCDLDQGRLE
jgi:cytochrome b pre-mRNA-processing protein 3